MEFKITFSDGVLVQFEKPLTIKKITQDKIFFSNDFSLETKESWNRLTFSFFASDVARLKRMVFDTLFLKKTEYGFSLNGIDFFLEEEDYLIIGEETYLFTLKKKKFVLGEFYLDNIEDRKEYGGVVNDTSIEFLFEITFIGEGLEEEEDYYNGSSLYFNNNLTINFVHEPQCCDYVKPKLAPLKNDFIGKEHTSIKIEILESEDVSVCGYEIDFLAGSSGCIFEPYVDIIIYKDNYKIGGIDGILVYDSEE